MPENASLIDQKGNGKNKSVEPVWRVNRQIKIQGRIVFYANIRHYIVRIKYVILRQGLIQ